MRRIIPTGSVILLLAVFVSVRSATYAQQSKKASRVKAHAVASFGNSDAITEKELEDYDYFLASDQLEGRNLPSRGFDTAALYVASHLAEWGLKPGGSTANTVGPLQPYFMPFELVSRQVVAEESKVSVTAPPGRGGRGGFGGAGGGGGGGRPGAAAGRSANDGL